MRKPTDGDTDGGLTSWVARDGLVSFVPQVVPLPPVEHLGLCDLARGRRLESSILGDCSASPRTPVPPAVLRNTGAHCRLARMAGLVVSIVKTAGGRAPAHQARGRGRSTWRPTERTAGARMVPPGEGNEARGDGRRGVGVSHSTAEAGELSPRDPVEGRGHRQVAPLEGKTANTPRLGPVSTSRQRIAELAR